MQNCARNQASLVFALSLAFLASPAHSRELDLNFLHPEAHPPAAALITNVVCHGKSCTAELYLYFRSLGTLLLGL